MTSSHYRGGVKIATLLCFFVSLFVSGYAFDAKIESNQSAGDDLSIGGFWKLGCL